MYVIWGPYIRGHVDEYLSDWKIKTDNGGFVTGYVQCLVSSVNSHYFKAVRIIRIIF